jgi:hypothetical protein
MFSHGLCPECYKKEMDDFLEIMERNKATQSKPPSS